jgi:hypothetical protein
MKLTNDQLGHTYELEALRAKLLPEYLKTSRVSSFLLFGPIAASILSTFIFEFRDYGVIIGASIALGFGLFVLYYIYFNKDESHLFIHQYKEDLIKPFLRAEYGAKTELDYATARKRYESSIYAPDYEDVRFLLGESFSIVVDGLDVAFYEIEVSYHTGKERRDHYAGAFVSVELPVSFSGLTVLSNLPGEFGERALEMDNLRFHGRYDVMSTNETEARYLLTPKVMENLEKLGNSIYNSIKLELFGNQIFLFLETKRDLMEPTDMETPVTSKSVADNLDNIRSEVSIVLDMVQSLELSALPEINPSILRKKSEEEKRVLTKAAPAEQSVAHVEKQEHPSPIVPDELELEAKAQEEELLKQQDDLTLWSLFYRGGVFPIVMFSFILYFMYAGDSRPTSEIIDDTVVRFFSVPDTIKTPQEFSKVNEGDLVRVEPRGYCFGYIHDKQDNSDICMGLRFLDSDFTEENANAMVKQIYSFTNAVQRFINEVDRSWKKGDSFKLTGRWSAYGKLERIWRKDFVNYNTVVQQAYTLSKVYGADTKMLTQDLLNLYAKDKPHRAAHLKENGIEGLIQANIQTVKDIDPEYQKVFRRNMDHFVYTLTKAMIDKNMDFPGYVLRLDNEDPALSHITNPLTPVSFSEKILRIRQVEHKGPLTVLDVRYVYGPMRTKTLITMIIFGLIVSNLIFSLIWMVKMNRRREGIFNTRERTRL